MNGPAENGRFQHPRLALSFLASLHRVPTMKFRLVSICSALCGMALVSLSCRKGKSGESQPAAPVVVVAAELESNGLGSLPGAVYHNQRDSAIHWQPWTQETLKRAKDAQRLVFGVVVMPQFPAFQSFLASLAGDPQLVATIHENYVPVLIDGDASRELGLLTADLCAEIQRPLQLPLLLWMTHEGNPVAWIPVANTAPEAVAGLFRQSHEMVSQMWQDAPGYVLKNSGQDNANRRLRLGQRKNAKVMSEQPAVDVIHSIRQLSSLYDPYSRSFDEIGGLFPSGAIELLAATHNQPGLADDVRARALETLSELMVDLLPSAMFDPLDGGVFGARRAQSWALPSFVRDCPSQARAAVALFQVYRATGEARVLERALGLIGFAEKSYLTPEGLFALGVSPDRAPEHWMWTIEDINRQIAPEDASWWIKATAMKGLGNLPSEADPLREFFRCNTLGMNQSPEEIAASLGLSEADFLPRFEAARGKLLAQRNARLGEWPRDDCSHAGATLRMVSAYAAAFGVTGDTGWRDKAVALLQRARQALSDGARLRNFSREAPESIGAGRAFLYGLALQAVIDVAAITSDDHWLIWAEDLATTAAELFTSSEFLKECPDEAKLIDLPVTDLVMLFDESTAGLVSSAECRFVELGRPLVASFSELATPMPVHARDRPVLHTDLLLAALARHYRVTVVVGAEVSPALQLAVERLPLRMIQQRRARPDDEVAPGTVKVLLSNGQTRTAASPEALQEVVLPSRKK